MFPYGEAIVVERPGGTDKWGQPLPGSSHEISGCAFAPRTAGAGGLSGSEDNYQHRTVTTGMVLYAPTGADITPPDVILRVKDGTRWHVQGHPGDWSNPQTGWRPGVEIELEKVTG